MQSENSDQTNSSQPDRADTLLKPNRPVGLVGYGAYIPRYRLPGAEVARVWTNGLGGSPIKEKAVAGLDEDVITMSIEAARNALARAQIPASALRTVWVGSESHPYAVKPTGTVVAEAIGAVPNVQAADWEFACKAGSEALQASFGFVGSGMADYAMCIGMDTAQGRPGDALEYTAASGGAAYIVGAAEESLAILNGSYSYVTDTPDFWRRAEERYPMHGDRFTGEPAYFAHVEAAASTLMTLMGTKAVDYRYVVFHQPNVKFPERAGKQLGFSDAQSKPGLLAGEVGNVYAGSCLLGLSATLDVATPGDRILCVSYGSGSGSDAFDFQVTDRITERQHNAPATRDYIGRRTGIDYALYARYRGNLQV